MNIRLLRHYLMLDPNLDAGTPRASSSLRLTDAILSSYYYSEAMLDRFHHLLLSARSATSVDENILKGLESHTIKQERELSLQITPSGQSLKQISEDTVSTPCALSFGINGLKGSSYFHLSDLVPFTRKPLFIITDCDSSKVSKNIYGAEQAEPAALFPSPSHTPLFISADFSRQPCGSLFTIFLTAPVHAKWNFWL